MVGTASIMACTKAPPWQSLVLDELVQDDDVHLSPFFSLGRLADAYEFEICSSGAFGCTCTVSANESKVVPY